MICECRKCSVFSSRMINVIRINHLTLSHINADTNIPNMSYLNLFSINIDCRAIDNVQVSHGT